MHVQLQLQRRLAAAVRLLQRSRSSASSATLSPPSASAAPLPPSAAPPLPAPPPPPTTRRAFVDKARIQVIGGRGGKGVISFESTSGDGWSKRPAGGTGGRGGGIIVRASASTQDLHMQTFVVRGRDGGDASGNKGSFGRDGRDKTIVVPVGTVVREVQRVYLVNAADVDRDVDEEEVAEGGGGGGGGGEVKGEVGAATGSGDDGGAETAASRAPGLRRNRPGASASPVAGGIVVIAAPAEVDRLRSRRAALSASAQRAAAGRGADADAEAEADDDSDHNANADADADTDTDTIVDNGARAGGASASSGGRRSGGIVRVNKSGMAFRETSVVLADLSAAGQSLLVARGGAPGVGNKGSILTYSEQRQEELRPHISGGRGEVRFLELELKTIADVGLVGFPNAGKSSFLAAISKVRERRRPAHDARGGGAVRLLVVGGEGGVRCARVTTSGLLRADSLQRGP